MRYALIIASSVTATAITAETDYDHIQGTWKLESTTWNGEEGGALAMQFIQFFEKQMLCNYAVFQGQSISFNLKPNANPKKMVLTFTQGENTSESSQVYELRGDTLIITVDRGDLKMTVNYTRVKEPLREWTDSTGKHKLQAALVTVDSKVVLLRRADNSISRIPIAKLSDADQVIVRKWMTEKGLDKIASDLTRESIGRNPGRQPAVEDLPNQVPDADGWVTYKSNELKYNVKLPGRPNVRNHGKAVIAGIPATMFSVQITCSETNAQDFDGLDGEEAEKTQKNGFPALFRKSQSGEITIHQLEVLAHGHRYIAVMTGSEAQVAKYSKKCFDSFSIDGGKVKSPDAAGWVTYTSDKFGYTAKFPAQPTVNAEDNRVSAGILGLFNVSISCFETELQDFDELKSETSELIEKNGFPALINKTPNGIYHELQVVAHGRLYFAFIQGRKDQVAKNSKRFFDSINITRAYLITA